MGGEAAEEQPRHTVKLERPFAIGLYEVSAGEFAQFCKHSNTPCPAQPWPDPALPVVNVSWALATAYAQWLSAISGIDYRLPSEAEWEYAARAGSTTAYPFGSEILPTHARYSFKSTVTTPLPAADRSVNRNDFKLYHMLGNVREWVADAWQASYVGASAEGRARSDGEARRVARGGSYADHASALRSAARVPLDPAGDAYTGFRVVRAVE
jgi:formylglycine-generating enzyme required for sulfatase activity